MSIELPQRKVTHPTPPMPSPTTTTAPLAPAPSDREDYPPDRSSYQPLPDTPDDGNSLAPLEADPDGEQDGDTQYSLEAYRSEYKRSNLYTAPLPGFVRKDIGIVRRAAKPQPLSPVLSLVGGVRGEKGFTGMFIFLPHHFDAWSVFVSALFGGARDQPVSHHPENTCINCRF